MTFPEIGSAPTENLMSACEVLCWIGYGRPIPKELYFAPAFDPPLRNVSQMAAAMHDAVPEPKPRIDPIDGAERALLKELHAGSLFARYKKEDGSSGTVPREAYYGGVAVNARGQLEHSSSASSAAWRLTPEPKQFGDLSFSTEEVLRIWPADKPTSGQPEERTPRFGLKSVEPAIVAKIAHGKAEPANQAKGLPARTRGRKKTVLPALIESLVKDFEGKPEELHTYKQNALMARYRIKGVSTIIDARKAALAILNVAIDK